MNSNPLNFVLNRNKPKQISGVVLICNPQSPPFFPKTFERNFLISYSREKRLLGAKVSCLNEKNLIRKELGQLME